MLRCKTGVSPINVLVIQTDINTNAVRNLVPLRIYYASRQAEINCNDYVLCCICRRIYTSSPCPVIPKLKTRPWYNQNFRSIPNILNVAIWISISCLRRPLSLRNLVVHRIIAEWYFNYWLQNISSIASDKDKSCPTTLKFS